MEVARLRVKDVDFERREIPVREGKGDKDRVTMLPASLVESLAAHPRRVRSFSGRTWRRAEAYLPFARSRKYPNAGRAWGWQYVFPAAGLSVDPSSGARRRHRVGDRAVQRAIRQAVRNAGIHKPATPHTLRLAPLPKNCPSGRRIRGLRTVQTRNRRGLRLRYAGLGS